MDRQGGIAMRFIQQFDVEKDTYPTRRDAFPSTADAALFLAGRDKRDLPFASKLADALEFVRLQLLSSVPHTEADE